MFFYLTLKKVVHVLNEDMPNVPVGLVGLSLGTKEQPLTIGDKVDKPDAAAEKKKESDLIDPAAQELQLKKEQQLWLCNTPFSLISKSGVTAKNSIVNMN
jgi:hypothetical protein